MERFHPNDYKPKLMRMQRGENPGMGQYGGNYHESDDDDADDEEEADSMDNNVESDSVSNSESDSNVDRSEDEESENWVFNDLIEEAEEELGKHATPKAIRKLFRSKLGDEIERYRLLRKNEIYKKIMTTAKDLQDGPGEYDRDEAVKVAIRQRRVLLDRLIPSPEPSDVGEAAEGENDYESDDGI